MKNNLLINLIILLCFGFLLNAQSTIIPYGDNWKYLDDGSNQGTSWYGVGFDDSSWSSGEAELGYGDGDETTVIGYGPDAANKYRTTYFRKTFTSSADFSDLNLDIIYDDGAVVYLNGVEVRRVDMPTGTITFNTLANNGSSDNKNDSSTIGNTLINGTNVIAVEIHQLNNSSSDLSFNLQLKGNPIETEYITDTSTWNYLDTGVNLGTTWTAIGYNDTSWSSGPSELGYGDSGDATTTVSFGPDQDNKYITTYFRKTINVTDAHLYSNLEMEIVRDDGMVVYVNGNEVWRDNLPSGTISYDTFANSAIGGDDESAWNTKTIGSTLIEGNNVIAVEMHQTNLTSSDLSFNFRLTAKGAVPAEIIRGPYLQSGTPNSVIIKYRTNTATETIVNYGTSLGNLNNSVSSMTKVIDHEIEISGLLPNTTYYYEIENISDGVYLAESANMFYKTAPPVGTNQLVRAWILGDPGTANNDQRAVRDQYYNYVDNVTTQNPGQTDMMLFLGDNAYNNGTDAEYQDGLFDIYHNMLPKSVAWSTIGNHDASIGEASSDSQSGPYFDIFTFPTNGEAGGNASMTEAYYSFDYANIHFIVLDSDDTDDRSDTGAMYLWCQTDIQNTTQDWIVALFHHPPYTKGSHDSDNTGDSGGRMQDMRETFLPLLEDNGVDLVLNGHSHSYERSFFLNGHYGISDTFNSSTMTVGDNGDGDGKEGSDGAYLKPYSSPDGAVYITTGSAGKKSGGTFDHEAMYYSVSELGSCVLEVVDNTMHVKFIRETGTVDDYFSIYKDDLIYSNNNWVSSITPSSGLTNTNTTIMDSNLTIDSDFSLDNLIVESGASVNVDPSQSLTIAGDINNNGDIILNSISDEYSSLIVNGSVTGDVQYNRHVNSYNGTTGNDLISAPVVGQNFGVFATNNPNIYENATTTSNKLFGPFNKTTGLYQNYDSSTDSGVTLNSGTGYRAARDASEDGTSGTTFTFTGSVNTGNVDVTLVNSGPFHSEWNLIGNPYTSYLDTSEFLTANTAIFNPYTVAIYGYNNDSNIWTVINLGNASANDITPGQGFFVATGSGGTATFTPSMRKTGSTDDFILGKNSTNSYLKLKLENNSQFFFTEFFIDDSSSKGFDLGYDTSVYGSSAPSFSMYSHLIEGNLGIDLAIQSINNLDVSNNEIIPLGINANQGEQITISIDESTLDQNIEVYLEDTVNSTFTLLNSNDFVITPSSNLTGTGRFFIHFQTQALSVGENELNNLQIINNSKSNTIKVNGVLTEDSTLSLYDIQGRLIFTNTLELNTNTQTISVPETSIGVYIVKVSNTAQTISKKVIFE